MVTKPKAKAAPLRPAPVPPPPEGEGAINLESQTRRLLALYNLAQAEGNLSVASQSLKQLTDLHGLAHGQGLDAQDLEDMSDEELDAQIRRLLKETGLADGPSDLPPTPTDSD